MKTSVKIILFAVTLALMTGCSAQWRAQRHLRRAVELCPVLEQKQARVIDTFLGVPVYTDAGIVPMRALFGGEPVTAKTDHGTFVLSVHDADGTLSFSFTPDASEIHYQDTLQFSQIVYPKEDPKPSWNGRVVLLWIIGVGCGVILVTAWIFHIVHFKHKHN